MRPLCVRYVIGWPVRAADDLLQVNVPLPGRC